MKREIYRCQFCPQISSRRANMEIHVRRKHPGKFNIFEYMKDPFYLPKHKTKDYKNSFNPYEFQQDSPNNTGTLYQFKTYRILKQIDKLDDNNFSNFVLLFTKYMMKRNNIKPIGKF